MRFQLPRQSHETHWEYRTAAFSFRIDTSNHEAFPRSDDSRPSFFGIGSDSNKCPGYGFYETEECTNSTDLIPLPLLLKYFQKKQIIQIDTGDYHSLFLCKSGTVHAVGYNHVGQCGIQSKTWDYFIREPIMIPCLKNIQNICCGQNHNLCLNKQSKFFSHHAPPKENF